MLGSFSIELELMSMKCDKTSIEGRVSRHSDQHTEVMPPITKTPTLPLATPLDKKRKTHGTRNVNTKKTKSESQELELHTAYQPPTNLTLDNKIPDLFPSFY